jgi:4-amino-4-deoxy-L-arabinose transferase-like glycosyltransferase
MAREDNKGLQAPPENAFPREDRVHLLAAIAGGLVLRLVAAWATGAAAPQEIRYITIAQGILEGRGFNGLDTRFPDIIQPPLAIGLLALALLFLPGHALVAARGLSVFAGTIVIVPVFWITRRLFGSKAARRAAWLAAVYPLLVHISGLCMTEPPFTVLVALAAIAVMKTGETRRETFHVVAAGLLLSLGFMIRPEGLAYLPVACALIFLTSWRGRGRTIRRSLALASLPAVAFIVAATPYWIWLHGETGHWLIAPKAVLTQVHNSIMAQAQKEKWPERYGSRLFYERVKFGLNPDGTELRSAEVLREVGLLQQGERSAAGGTGAESLIQPGNLLWIVFRNFRTLYLDTIKYGLVLPTFVLGFLALGLTARPWLRGESRREQGIVLCFVLAGCSWILSYVHYRFLYPSVVFLIPWMAEGWVKLEEWLSRSFVHLRSRREEALAPLYTLLLGLLTAAACLVHVVPPIQSFSSVWKNQALAGTELRESGADRGLVMALTPVPAFYAQMPFDVMPYADLESLLGYARRKGVRYLVADMAEFPTDRPQLLPLLDPLKRGAPKLRIAVDVGTDPEHRVVVYDLAPAEINTRLGDAPAATPPHASSK